VIEELTGLMHPTGPFVLGEEFSTAEIITASFILRLLLLVEHNVFGEEVAREIKNNKRFKVWTDALRSRPSISGIFEEKAIWEAYEKRLKK